MKIAVFGANGPTGRLLTKLALDEDHDVVAFTRRPAAFPIQHRRLEVAAGDVAESAAGRFPVDSALHRQVSQRFMEACAGGDLEGLLALLDPVVEGAGDVVPGVLVGAAKVAPGIMGYLGPPTAPTLLHLPVGDRIGIVALRGRRVAALVLLTIHEDGLIAHVDALAGAGPRAAVSAALGLGG